MELNVFEDENGLKCLEVVKGSQRVSIESQSVFECVLLNHAFTSGMGVPPDATDFGFADVGIVFCSLPPYVPFGTASLPLFVKVDPIPVDTTRLYFAFWFPGEMQVLLLGGAHVCFLEHGDFKTETLLANATPEIWLRTRDQHGSFFPLYHYPLLDAIPRTELVKAVDWRMSMLVHGPDTLVSRLNGLRSDTQRFQTALAWHQETFGNFTEEHLVLDSASFWITLAASETFPAKLFRDYRRAERWLIRIRARLLCKNEREFEALIAHEVGEPLNLRSMGFLPRGPRRRGGAGPSDPWMKLPRDCPDKRFEPAYAQATKKGTRLCVRKSRLTELAHPKPMFHAYPNDVTRFFSQEIVGVSGLVGPDVGHSARADLGDLAVVHTPPRLAYETAFEDALDALATRKGVLRMGQIVLPWYHAYEILQARFDKRVDMARRHSFAERLFGDQINGVRRHCDSIDADRRLIKYEQAIQAQPANLPVISEIEHHLPPCMRGFLEKIKVEGRIDNDSRFAFIGFLLKIGYAIESVIALFRRYWDPKDWIEGDVQPEFPDLAKRYKAHREGRSERGVGYGCNGLQSRGYCPLTGSMPRKYLGKIYNQPVVDIEDCADGDTGKRCTLVLKWRGKHSGFPISSPQNFVRRSLKS